MADPTHYDILGVVPTAEDVVIRAAYRALSLIYHPDKTLQLPPEERARRSSIFFSIGKAHEVLSNRDDRAAYDAQLARRKRDDTLPRRTPTSTISRRKKHVRLTTPEEKRAMKAKAEQDLAYVLGQRAKRDADAANMDLASLKVMLQIWFDMANEADGDALLKVHCEVQIKDYMSKIAKREQDNADWLKDMSKAKHSPNVTPQRKPPTPTPNAPRKHHASRASFAPETPTPQQQAEAQMRFDADVRAGRVGAHADDRTYKEAHRKSHFDAKQDAVRAEKERLRRKAEEQDAHEAERVARARAGAARAGQGAATLGRARDAVPAGRSRSSKGCGRCGVEHATFAEWRACNLKVRAQRDDESFFTTV